VAVTVAFGIAAPVVSVTVPVIVPSPAVCALSVTGAAMSAVTMSTANALRSIVALFCNPLILCVIAASSEKIQIAYRSEAERYGEDYQELSI
jgi:hypothetical protein